MGELKFEKLEVRQSSLHYVDRCYATMGSSQPSPVIGRPALFVIPCAA